MIIKKTVAIKVRDIQQCKRLGSRKVGDVYLWKGHALKMSNGRFNKSIDKEIKLLIQLRQGPYIVKLMAIVHDSKTSTPGYLMSLYDGSLQKQLDTRYNKENVFSSVSNNISLALEYLHSKNILHLDVKPDNILYKNSDNSYVLCDFSNAMETLTLVIKLNCRDKYYTRGYRLYREYQHYDLIKTTLIDTADDWFALLITLLNINGEHPLKNQDTKSNSDYPVELESMFENDRIGKNSQDCITLYTRRYTDERLESVKQIVIDTIKPKKENQSDCIIV